MRGDQMQLNQGLKEENIHMRLKEINRLPNQNYVYGTVMPGTVPAIMLGGLMALAMEYHIVAFYADEIVLLPMNVRGNFKENYFTFQRDDMEIYNVKEGWLRYKIKIQTQDDRINLVVNKKLLGKPWHTNNLEYLRSKKWYQ